jgi:hypothetical protein
VATNKKITQLDELTPATWADDDVIAIVDISAQETKKIQLSTFRGAVAGVSSLNASTPLTVDSATGDVTISVAIDGGGTINAVFDEDNMASNSPTALATQQSIKAYVDSQVGTVDTLAEILANGNTSGGTNIVVSSGDVITTNTINETTGAAGVTIDGVLVKDGEVDGRDVSVDGTKLDTVETNADVTDTTNVTAAGALMDSELTNITAVKALDQGVATTDTPTFAGLITAGNVDGRDVSVDGAKLDGIEAGADVTDTANVTAAGALMDSELTNITAVKALNQGVATTDSPSFAGLTATTADINGGTIDGAVIGGASAAAGTFTTLATSSISLTGSTLTGPANEVIRFKDDTADAVAYIAVESQFGVARFGTFSNYPAILYDATNYAYHYDSNNLISYLAGDVHLANAAGPALMNEAATSTNPSVLPNKVDTDTGIGWVSADIAALVAGGSEALRWNANGIGIGGATPTNLVPLNMSGASAGNNYAIRVGNTSTDGYSSLQLGPSGDAGLYRTGSAQSAYGGNNSLNLLTVGAHNIALGTANAVRWTVDGTTGDFSGINAAGPSLLNEAATSTNPTLVPNKADPDTGMGWVSANVGALIAGGTKNISWDNTHVGLNGMTPNAPAQGNFSVTMGGIGSTGSGLLQIVGNAAGAYRNAGVHFVGYDGGSYSENAVIEQHYTTGTASGSLVFKTKAQAGSLTTALTLGDDQNATFTGNVSLSNATGPALMNEAASATNPTIIPNRVATTSGFGANGAGNTIYGIGSGAEHFRFGNSAMHISVGLTVAAQLSMDNAAGPTLLNEAATSTNPTLVPNRADTDTGVGWNSTNIGSLIAGGTEVASFAAAAFNITGAANVKQANNGNTGGLVLTRSDTSTYSSLYTGGGDSTILQFNGGRYIAITSTTGDTGGASSAGSGNQYVELLINGSRYKLLHDGTI